MAFFNTQILSLSPSATLKLTQKAQQLRAQGKNILSLTVGEPDYPTPEWIKEAARQALKDNQTFYTNVGGTQELKAAICEKFQRENQITFTQEEIIVSTGAKQVLFNAFATTLSPGDAVIIPTPYWVSYSPMVEFFQGKPVFVPCTESEGFKLTPEKLRENISSNTKWLILNNPNNPSGALYSPEELQELAKVLEEFPHVWILSDEIYEHIHFDKPFCSFGKVAESLKSRTLLVNGLSKAFSMTGWRIGYGAGPSDLIKAMAKLQSQSTSNPCSLSQKAGEAALKETMPQEKHSDFHQQNQALFKERRDRVIEWVQKIPGMAMERPPEGAFYSYINCQGLIGLSSPEGSPLKNDEDVANFLMDHAEVAVVPGSAFGLSPYIRASYAADISTLDQAFSRILKACQEIS